MDYGKVETEKMYFSSTETAEAVGVEIKVLRDWEKQFKSIIHPKKGATGKRIYKTSDIEALKKIKTLIEEENLSPDEIALRLSEEQQTLQEPYEKHNREFLLNIRENLMKILDKIKN